MDELRHLLRLSAVKSGRGVKFLSPAVSPGCHCPMRMAALTSKEIRGLSSLLVGMPECTTHVRLFNPRPEGRHGELHWLYVLDAHEVVFGCREGLMDALKKMDKAGAKAILLIVTCIPELTGEDIEGIVRELQPELCAPLALVMLGQFKNFSYPPGYWKTLAAMGSLMSAKRTDPLRINVCGRRPDETHIALPTLLPELQRRGLSLRYLAPGASLRDFQDAPDAALNLVLSPYAQPLAARMEREFGLPQVSLQRLYSLEAIDGAYEKIAERFSFAWNGEFAEERAQALALEKEAAIRLAGLRFVLAPGVETPLALAAYLAGFGMQPLLLHMEEFYPQDKAGAQVLLAQGHNPLLCRMVNALAEYPLLERLGADICFGYLPPECKAIANVEDMYQLYGRAGYELTGELLRRTLEVLDKVAPSGKGGTGHGTASV